MIISISNIPSCPILSMSIARSLAFQQETLLTHQKDKRIIKKINSCFHKYINWCKIISDFDLIVTTMILVTARFIHLEKWIYFAVRFIDQHPPTQHLILPFPWSSRTVLMLFVCLLQWIAFSYFVVLNILIYSVSIIINSSDSMNNNNTRSRSRLRTYKSS